MENVRKFGLNGFQLKILGIIMMFMDHIYQMFYPIGAPLWLHIVGRTVAPIFMFLTIEGYVHTRDVKKYMGRLLIGYYIMVVGNFMIPKVFPMEEIVLINNIFGDLFLGVFYIYIIENIREKVKDKSYKKIIKYVLIGLIPFGLSVVSILAISLQSILLVQVGFIFPQFFSVESGMIHVPLIIALYYCRKKRWAQALMVALVAFLNLFTGNTLQFYMIFAVIPIMLYNGQKGKGMKYFFYAFYIIHIYALYVLSYFIMK